MQRQGVGLTANMAGDHGDGTELPHGTGGTEQQAIHQAPADAGQGDPPEHLQAARPQHDGGFLLFRTTGLHLGQQLAHHEGHGNEGGRQYDPRGGEDDLDVVLAQPVAKPAATTEHQHEHQACYHGRDRERQIDEGDEQLPAREAEAGYGPGGRQPEQQVEGHGAEGHQGRQAEGAQGIRLADGMPEEGKTWAQCLDKDGGKRQQQQGGEPAQPDTYQQPLHPDGLTGHGRLAHLSGRHSIEGQIQACVGCVHMRLPPMRAQLQACNLLMINSKTNEISSMTEAMAEAPA
ncbi:hypothetical protein D3C79_650490 [compost metagenome]